MFVCVRAFVCAYMREGAQERERKTERKEKLCHYASIKQKAQWCHSAVCFVSLCVHLCVRMYVGVLVCVCVLFLAVSSQCVLFSFPNETLTIIFSKGESKDSKRDQGWCVVWTLLSVCVCVCVFLGTVYKGASGKSSNTAWSEYLEMSVLCAEVQCLYVWVHVVTLTLC